MLNLTFPEPMMIGVALLVLHLVLMVTSKKWETRLEMDVFADPRRASEAEQSDVLDEEYYAPHFENEAEKRQYEMNEKMREEQMERIRKLLSRNDEDDEQEK